MRPRHVTAVLAALIFSTTYAMAADPVFSVHKNGTAQTVVADTATLLTWATEVIDTNTNFATNRFTPTVAGNYLIVVSTQCAQPGACVPSIYKNGALYAGSRITNQTFADQSPQATAIVAMNGSTDYIEAFTTSSGTSIGGAATQTYFNGTLVAGAGGSSTPAGTVAGAVQFRGATAVFAADDVNLVWDDTNSRLGIGTATPRASLEVAGAVRLRAGAPGNDAATVGLAFEDNGDTGLYMTNYTSSATGDLHLYSNAQSRLTVLSSGNVGIGTSTPGAKLNVAGSQGLLSRIDSPNNALFVYVDDATGTFTGSTNTVNVGSSRLGSGVLPKLRLSGQGGLEFAVDANSVRMVIDPSGNVGIGTASPVQKLHVHSSSTDTRFQMTNSVTGSTASDGLMFEMDPSGDAYLWQYENRPMYLGTNGALQLSITGPGNVGIGTSNPAQKFDVATNAGLSGNIGIRSDRWPGVVFTADQDASSGGAYTFLATVSENSGYLEFRPGVGGTSSGLILAQSGNVGIGTTTPGTTLDVGGVGNVSTLRVNRFQFYDDNVNAGFSNNNAGAFLLYNNVGAADTSVAYRFHVTTGGLQAVDITNNGYVGIGTTNPGYRVELPNVATVAGRGRANQWATYSDGRFKKNVTSIEDALEKVIALRGVTYTSTTESNGIQQVGFIAQEVERVVPEVVSISKTRVTKADGTVEDVSDYRSMAYDRLVPVLAEAIKELKAANDNLRAEHTTQIEELRAEIEALKAAR